MSSKTTKIRDFVDMCTARERFLEAQYPTQKQSVEMTPLKTINIKIVISCKKINCGVLSSAIS